MIMMFLDIVNDILGDILDKNLPQKYFSKEPEQVSKFHSYL